MDEVRGRRPAMPITLALVAAALAPGLAGVPGCVTSEKSRYETHLSAVVPQRTSPRDDRSLAARDTEPPALSVLPDETREDAAQTP